MTMSMFTRADLTRAIAIALSASSLLLAPQLVAAQNVHLDNLGDRGFRIDGIDADDRAGFSVAGAGDVNGDGLADLIVGAYRSDAAGAGYAGESYVVFGKTTTERVQLDNLADGGFRIEGIDVRDFSGISVSGAGDVNGDGLADLIVGAPGSAPRGDLSAGESYVVFGKTSNTTVDLAALGAGGFRIQGIDADDRLGRSVSGAGDVNGDGLADLIVGAYAADPGGDSYAGESYVVFGKADSTAVDLANLADGGFRIDGIDAIDTAGLSVSGAGDVNGDGLADVIVGAYRADRVGDNREGESYVVFGKADSTPVDLANLGAGGFRIDGIDANDYSGISVSGAGDVNGDGLADLIVGAAFADPAGALDAGESYVVFGKAGSAPVDLAELASGGFRIEGIDVGDRSGFSVSGAGDVNGDGLADLIVGAFGASPGGAIAAGESFVVFGKADSTSVDLGGLGLGGYRIDGIDSGDFSGRSVSAAGDVNGDGMADLIIGAFGAAPGGLDSAGQSYVVFSNSVAPNAATYLVRNRNGDAQPLAVGTVGDGSNDSTPDARLWIDFADGDDPAAVASTETVTLIRSAAGFGAAAAGVSWRVQSSRANWTAAGVVVRYLDRELQSGDEASFALVYSAIGNAPFVPLATMVDPANNTLSAVITAPGYLYILEDAMFANGFESLPP